MNDAEQMRLEDIAAAQRAVDLARQCLRPVQRQHTHRAETGAATLTAAESLLSAALDRLEHVTGGNSR